MAKPVKVHITRLTVQGSGEFPIDMLRYDRCSPETEEDSNTIEQHGFRTVTLWRFSVDGTEATRERWMSFGWNVVSEAP